MDGTAQVEPSQAREFLKTDEPSQQPACADSVPDGFQVDDKELARTRAVVSSMTKQERSQVDLFQKQPSRIKRVANGSGVTDKTVGELLQKFSFMQQMMGNIGQQAGMLSKIPGMKQMAAAQRMRDVVKTGGLEQNPMMANLADTLLEAAVAEQGGPMQANATRKKPIDKAKKKSKRKMQKKSRRKSRR